MAFPYVSSDSQILMPKPCQLKLDEVLDSQVMVYPILPIADDRL